ncbi:hypothetical protein [Adhaeribacter aquaticus]|uniref:hypothetical protein n=1 Tax=Adhaeribacter aquaticus TaxID=299567 RepID=UPI000423172B|nr:hypothetical protein [Adhaeribacter aquaticus]
MGKIKYQGGLTKLITSKIGNKNKLKFAEYIDKNLPHLGKSIGSKPVQMEVISFSSNKDFYDQILSILSYLRYLGKPISWTIYSDGSHTTQQINLLKSGFDFVEIKGQEWENVNKLPDNCKPALKLYEPQLLHYAKNVPLGKRLFYYLNHEIKYPTLFLDADILFYDKATVFDLILQEDVNGWFLPDDGWGCLDSRYIKTTPKQMYQVNGGFFLINKELANLTEGLEFLKSLNFEYEYFSDQNVFHILFRENGFMPLDPRIFILNSNDQFDFSYLYPKDQMAIRHYTGPVRHKMWQKDWNWQLSLS